MLRHYLVLAAKVLVRRKFFTFISLFGIAFTLVVLVVAAAFLDSAFGPAEPEVFQDRTLGVHGAVMWGKGNRWTSQPGYLMFDRYARNLPGVERLSVYSSPHTVSSFVDGRKIELTLKRTDGEFWRILRFDVLEGQPYTTADVEAAAAVAVISSETRRKLFGDLPAVGRVFEADGQRFRVAGVVADVSALRRVPYADVWVPITTAKHDAYKRDLMGGFEAIALGVSRDALPLFRDEFNARLKRAELPSGYEGIVAPFETTFGAVARELRLRDYRDDRSHAGALYLFLGGLAFLFALLPTVNLVNINMSRILERASEIGVRKAFGAPSMTLVGQFIVENVVLTLAGSVLAFVASFFVLAAINDSGLIPHASLGVNWRVFGAGVGLALIFGLLSGVYPAWRMSRLRPADALKGGGR
jgi:putative ABC transport system permease protein